tara:strand:+ start:814 stop:1410 length:597 start_codon:yes stop_codon:yes gene_type:complete
MSVFFKDDTNVLVRDQNRYRKIYRYIRKKPAPLNCAGANLSVFTWGCYFVEFDNQTSLVHNFPCCFDSAPAVIATTVSKDGSLSNFNTFVSSVSASQCTFETSGNYTGYVYYQAIVDGVYSMPDIGRSLEVKTISFNNTNTASYTFTASFSCVPIVTATADQDVNVFITALSKTAVTVEVSQANYNGNVYIQAIEKGC